AWFQIASPAAQVDTAQHDLPVSRSHQRVCLRKGAIHGQRAALSADAGNNAERTSVVAAVLDLEVGTGPSRVIIIGVDWCGDELCMSKNIAHQSKGWTGERKHFAADKTAGSHSARGNLSHAMLVRVPDNAAHAGQGTDFLGRSLGVT